MGRCYNGNVWIRLTSKMMICGVKHGDSSPKLANVKMKMRFLTIKFGCTLIQTNPNTHQNLEILEIQVEHRIDKASQHFTAIVSPSVSTFLRGTRCCCCEIKSVLRGLGSFLLQTDFSSRKHPKVAIPHNGQVDGIWNELVSGLPLEFQHCLHVCTIDKPQM